MDMQGQHSTKALTMADHIEFTRIPKQLPIVIRNSIFLTLMENHSDVSIDWLIEAEAVFMHKQHYRDPKSMQLVEMKL